MRLLLLILLIIFNCLSLKAQVNSVYARDTLNMGTPNANATNKTKWIRVSQIYGHGFGIGRGQNDTVIRFSPTGIYIPSGIYLKKDSSITQNIVGSNFLLSLDTSVIPARITKILPSSLGFATGNTLYTGDGTATNRTVNISGYINWLGGEMKIGSATDQGAFSLQNTGGLYQNGTVSLRGTLAATSAFSLLGKQTDSSIIQMAAVPVAMGGMPVGGTTGQVPTKNSGTNYDYSWTTPSIPTTIYTGDGTLSGDRQLLGAGQNLTLGTQASNVSQFSVNSTTRINLFGLLVLNQKTASDANYTFGNETTLRLPQITANRTLNSSFASGDSGIVKILVNENASQYKWSIANTIIFPSGYGTNDLDNQTTYYLQAIGDGSVPQWKVLSIVGTPPVFTSSSSTLNLQYSSYNSSTYVNTGASATYTLTPINTNKKGYVFYIKNRGTGNLIINSFLGGNDIYDTAPTNTITILPGGTVILTSDNTYFNVFN